MPSVLITDADLGLGPELVRQYSADGFQVYAACAGTFDFAHDGKVTAVRYVAADRDGAAHLAAQIGTVPLDIVIAHSGESAGGDRSVADVTRTDWEPMMTAASFNPVKLVIALRPNLESGGAKKLVGISSFAASIGSSSYDGSYSFRAAKAALNSIWRTFSIEWRPLGICCLLLCADQKTLATGSISGFSPKEVASALRRVIQDATLESSGCFFGAGGGEIAW